MQEIEINAYDISSYVLIGQCPNHNNHKIKTLSLIDDIILSDIHFPGTSISKTDWNLSITIPRHYFNHIRSSWEEYFGVIYGYFGFNSIIQMILIHGMDMVNVIYQVYIT